MLRAVDGMAPIDDVTAAIDWIFQKPPTSETKLKKARQGAEKTEETGPESRAGRGQNHAPRQAGSRFRKTKAKTKAKTGDPGQEGAKAARKAVRKAPETRLGKRPGPGGPVRQESRTAVLILSPEEVDGRLWNPLIPGIRFA